jgi:hypothetical protein
MNKLLAKKFADFCYNFDSSLSWIDEIQWTCDASYMKEKFRRGYDLCGNAGVVVYFFLQCDIHNQEALLDYIDRTRQVYF